ncbi:MAG: FadR/GntR family transcriptional regulator [Trebonia sp.]
MVSTQQRAAAVKVQTLPVQVAALLVRRIVNGELQGSHAPSEMEICREFGLSRSVARETFKLLASLDIVEVAQGRRNAVRPAAEWDYLNPLLMEWLPEDHVLGLLTELQEMRLLLEPELAAKAAAASSGDALASLRSELERMTALESDPDDYLEVDLAFHMVICRAADNRILDRIMYSARWLLSASRRVTNEKDDALHRATRAHARIFAAIEARDPAAARQVMRDHLQTNSTILAVREQSKGVRGGD